jgi:hypothetical protein
VKVQPQAAARRLGRHGTSLPPRLLDRRYEWKPHANASIYLRSLQTHKTIPEMLFLETIIATIESVNGLGAVPKVNEVPSYRSVIAIVTVPRRASISIILLADL